MYAKFLPAVAAVGVMTLAAEAGAILPPGAVYNSGMTGILPVGTFGTSTSQVHVVFLEGTIWDTYEWIPAFATFSPLGLQVKPMDGHLDYVVGYDGGGQANIWTSSVGWNPLPPPMPANGSMSVWDQNVATAIPFGPEGAVWLDDLASSSSAIVLDTNGRFEFDLSLYQDYVAYQYWDFSGVTGIAVFDTNSALEIFHEFNAFEPDLYGTRIAFVSGRDIHIRWLFGGFPLVLTAPAGCSFMHPNFAGDGRWIAYVAACGGSLQVRVLDLYDGTDYVLDDISDPTNLHAGPNWIVWTDPASEVKALVW